MYTSDAIPQLKHAITHLENHLTAPTSITEAAASVGYSRYHFSRLFLAVTGITPVAYLRKRRLTEAARELAISSKRILDIALDYQFQSQEAFTRSFKQEFGVSPGFYRMQKRLRRLFERITLGISNLLYPGKGVDVAPPLVVPERQIVAALIVPYVRNRQLTLPVQGVTPMTKESVKIRLAHRQDLPALCRLYHELHAFTVQGVPDRLRRLDDFDYFGPSWLSLTQAKLLDAVNVAIWVAAVNGQVVGLAEVYLREDESDAQHTAYRYGYLQSLVVDKAWRGLGIGRQLLAAAEEWSRRQGATELRLESWEFDQGPLGFYERQGYRTLRRTLVRTLQDKVHEA
ncbi:MAG: GNAT family N-acetyltransferase [Caldilinea sp. CFX5]|nr:GNAT family N-acetyltransferase [Caldilinea sp. CFX5]